MADSSSVNAQCVYRAVREHKVIAIVRGLLPSAAVSVAEALYAGGIRLMEITCNTPGVAEMISEVLRAMEGRMLIGAGTVITVDLAERVHQAGAQYMVAPDVNPDVIRYCTERDVAVIPGAATATEVLNAYRLGLRMVKIFPADGLGVSYIKQLRGPLDDVEFVAVGGVTVDNVGDFLRAGCVGAGLGASLVRKSLVDSCDWAGMAKLASEVRDACAGRRTPTVGRGV